MTRFSRITALLLVLILPCAACFSAAAEEDRYGKYPETVKISLLQTDPIAYSSEVAYDPSRPDRASANENVWVQGYLDHLNIDIERIIAEDATALNAIVNTSMAGGDLPDIMVVSKGMFDIMNENDVLANLGDAFESYTAEHGALLKEVMASVPQDTIDACYYEGELKAIPMSHTDYYNATDVLWLRQDWLDAVGKTAPTTIDEMIDVAKAFMEAKLGGDGTRGLCVKPARSSMVKGIEENILAAYGVVMDTWSQQEDGTYVYSSTTDAMKDGLLKMQEMYRDGVLKSDFAVTDSFDQDIINGKAGMFYAPAWYSVTAVKANLLSDPNAVWICAPIPTLDGKPVKQYTNATLSSVIVVNKECKHPEALLKMLEFELKVFYEPTDAEQLAYLFPEDGYIMWNLRPFRGFGMTSQDLYRGEMCLEYMAKGAKSADEMPAIASTIYDLFEPVIKSSGIYNTGVWDGNRDDVNSYANYYTFTVGYPIVEAKRDAGELVGGYNGPSTDNIATYESTLREMLTNAMIKVIMGEEITVFEKAVKTWYASGGQAITNDVNAYYQSVGK